MKVMSTSVITQKKRQIKMLIFALIALCTLPIFGHSVVEMDIDQGHYNNAGTFSLASYFGDHMVLQGEPQKAVIWGYAPKGSEGLRVTIGIENSTDVYTTHVDTSLTWEQSIGPMKSGGPYTIKAELEGGKHSVMLNDVLFGDVWVCSGQSNMQFSIDQVFNASFELKDSLHYPNIRLFVVKDNTSNTPLTDLSKDGISLPWSLPSPATLGGGSFNYFSAVCWLYGKYLYQHLKKPLGLVETCWGGTPVEAWSSPQALSKCGLSASIENNQSIPEEIPPELRGPPGENSVLWNAMVNPLLRMSIFGAIWYQGEANTNKNKDLYSCTFPAMIDDWRKQFSASGGSSNLFPFGFVQLAGFNPSYSEDTGFPDIRWHQTADYGYAPNHRQRNVFMAVAMDLPDFLSPYGAIHPRDKQDVAARLVRSGLNVAYGLDVSYQGPFPVSANITVPSPGATPILSIQYTMDVTQKWLDGFEICCAFTTPPRCHTGESWWVPTAAAREMHQANTTTLNVMECKLENIVGLRYAWRDSPCGFFNCAIYGADNGLPMPPFTYSFHYTRQYVSKDSFVVNMLQ